MIQKPKKRNDTHPCITCEYGEDESYDCKDCVKFKVYLDSLRHNQTMDDYDAYLKERCSEANLNIVIEKATNNYIKNPCKVIDGDLYDNYEKTILSFLNRYITGEDV